MTIIPPDALLAPKLADPLPFLKTRQAAVRPSAIVFCEANFGAIDGKTANGLVRSSDKYNIVAVIDSTRAGMDAGSVLDGAPNGIPIFRDLGAVLNAFDIVPSYFIYGMAPSTGMLSANERKVVLSAIENGMNVVNGLHEFLTADPEFVKAAKSAGITILDVRKPRPKNELRLFSGRINAVTTPRIAVLGTECAIGKRTTASILARALNERGIKAVMVATGQTGLIQGGRYGVALDAVPSQFCCGELEATIIEASENERPDIIVIEGQGALGHPAFCTSAFILRGSVPDSVILQHAPGRTHRCDYEAMAMPSPRTEIDLIQSFADTKVIGMTINHENMNDDEVTEAIRAYQDQLNIPVTDALLRPTELLVQMVLSAHPQLERNASVSVQ
jgi:uncharacterized NAD-dependent epimerase/dehydratase family protein